MEYTTIDHMGGAMADRPLECGECRRAIKYHYKEIVGNNTNELEMCGECPVLRARLHGEEVVIIGAVNEVAGIACGGCGTTLQEVKTGHPLGCGECYDVFSDLLLHDLVVADKVSKRFASKAKRSTPLHLGRIPGQATEVSPALRLAALQEALKETLTREDYEQAAWLRDEIKGLTEKKNDEPEKKKPRS